MDITTIILILNLITERIDYLEKQPMVDFQELDYIEQDLLELTQDIQEVK